MVNLRYHKGSFCIYKPRFCQEGYCSECAIHLQMDSVSRAIYHNNNVKNTRKLQETGIRENVS